jgi:effector-binding domain-containing protein
MSNSVSIQIASSRTIAAVRRQVRVGQVANTWRPALDQVWAFLRQNPGLRTDGHNIFLYHHPAEGESTIVAYFGVEVTRPFAQSGEVVATETPAGRVASALHIGPYDRLGETYKAINTWAAANNATFAGKSWEIYGDPTDDVAKLETRIEYLLAETTAD